MVVNSTTMTIPEVGPDLRSQQVRNAAVLASSLEAWAAAEGSPTHPCGGLGGVSISWYVGVSLRAVLTTAVIILGVSSFAPCWGLSLNSSLAEGINRRLLILLVASFGGPLWSSWLHALHFQPLAQKLPTIEGLQSAVRLWPRVLNTHVRTCTQILQTKTYTCTYIHIHIHLHIHVHVHLHVHRHAPVHLHVHIHTYT